MNHETAWRVLWCLWFACVMGGPYVLGNHGDACGWMYSGSYGFVAFGLLLGIWAGHTAVVRVACRNEKTKWSFLGVGLGLNLLLVLLELFALLLPVALDSPNFSALLLQEGSGVPYDWVLGLSGAGVEAGYYEKGLAFIFAMLCGVAFQVSPSQAIDFKDLSSANNGDMARRGRASFGRWNEATVRAILVALPGIVFAVGVTRTSIGATLAMPVGLLAAFLHRIESCRCFNDCTSWWHALLRSVLFGRARFPRRMPFRSSCRPHGQRLRFGDAYCSLPMFACGFGHCGAVASCQRETWCAFSVRV